jgi:phage terminase small subunit
MDPMDLDFIAAQLKLPPERVRLRELYPELPEPIPFGDVYPLGPWSEDEGDPPELRGCHYIYFDHPALPTLSKFAVTEQHFRIAEEYDDARERQYEADAACAAARWENRSPDSGPREPEPEAIPPRGELTARQEEFCRHYATQPVAMRAAVLAGYSEESADTYGPRLLRNPLVLDRIAKLRQERHVRYVVERDTLHDKLEAVFFGALAERNHAAAVSALRLQAALGGLSLRPGGAAAAADATDDEARARDPQKSEKIGVRPRQKSGKVRIGGAEKSGKVRKRR